MSAFTKYVVRRGVTRLSHSDTASVSPCSPKQGPRWSYSRKKSAAGSRKWLEEIFHPPPPQQKNPSACLMPKRHSGVRHINSLVTDRIWHDTSCQPCLFSPLLQSVFAHQGFYIRTLCQSYSWKPLDKQLLLGILMKITFPYPNMRPFDEDFWDFCLVHLHVCFKNSQSFSLSSFELNLWGSIPINELVSSGSFWANIAANVFSCVHMTKNGQKAFFSRPTINRFFF